MFEVIVLEEAEKDLAKMDKFEATKIIAYLGQNIEGCEDPKAFGRSLKELDPKDWRYRVGQMRILCELDYQDKIVYVHAVRNRSKAYK